MKREQQRKTAFVLAGGGSLGAVQVGMLKALAGAGIIPDLVVGASVGAINGLYFASDPTPGGVARLERIWQRLHRRNVFPLSATHGLLGLFGRRNHVVAPSPLRTLVKSELPCANIEDCRIACAVVATDVLEGTEVTLTRGPTLEALLASAAIPAVFPPVKIDGRYLMDGGVANNTPINTAIRLGASHLIVLPTGFSCATTTPPAGAMAMGLHALNLMMMRQLLRDIASFADQAQLAIVPPLCPLATHPFDFSMTAELTQRAERQTREWLARGGPEMRGLPHELEPHTDKDHWASEAVVVQAA